MGSREQQTLGELIITKGIRGRKAGIFSKPIKCYAGVPATIVANRYFASAAMHNGVYAVLNSGLPGDGLAHNVTCAQTAVDVEDTNGKLTITGLDIFGKIITEEIIPNGGATVAGLKAFKKVTSIVGSGWAQGGTGPDTIIIGFGEVIGLPDVIEATTDVLLVAFSTAIVNGPTVVVGALVANNTVLVPTGDGSKKLSIVYQV